MKSIIRTICFILLQLLYTACRLDAQVYLHVDRSKYIAGEDLWFSIYSIDPESGKLSSKSAIAYIELLNPWNKPLIQKRFRLYDGRGEGNFLLPDSVSSGTYTVRAYTRWMENFLPDNCFMYEINVFNPFSGLYFWRKTDAPGSSPENLMKSADNKESTLYLNADSIYGRREKVSLKIGIYNKNTNLSGISEMSISVAPADVSDSSRWLNDYSVPDADPKLLKYERDGHYLSGRIRYREGNIADSSDFLYMSVQGKVAEFNYAPIDTSGRFSFILPFDNKLRNLILQPENANINMILEIEPSFSRRLPVSQAIKENFSDSLSDEFSGLSFNYQAERYMVPALKKRMWMMRAITLKREGFTEYPRWKYFWMIISVFPLCRKSFLSLFREFFSDQ